MKKDLSLTSVFDSQPTRDKVTRYFVVGHVNYANQIQERIEQICSVTGLKADELGFAFGTSIDNLRYDGMIAFYASIPAPTIKEE